MPFLLLGETLLYMVVEALPSHLDINSDKFEETQDI